MLCSIFFFFNDTPTTDIYTLSLHDALPIYRVGAGLLLYADDDGRLPVARSLTPLQRSAFVYVGHVADEHRARAADRKSTRLNSSHSQISYAVFCLKKKTKKKYHT